ncbi:MAG: response regulator [Bacteroidetes bacterium]|jgi:CheY-like chemotaxis protein|nr:response regulator [Bacteroidota bacterium]
MAPKPPKSTFEIVMLIDDNEIDNFINDRMIKGCNFSENVYVNTGTQSALEFLKNMTIKKDVRKEHLPSIIFLDINMPILDGFHFLEEFEKLDQSLIKDIKIYMLTSSIDPSDLSRSEKYKSVKGFLYKPLTQDALQKLATA